MACRNEELDDTVFWQQVYLAKIGNGFDHLTAADTADMAVFTFNQRFYPKDTEPNA